MDLCLPPFCTEFHTHSENDPFNELYYNHPREQLLDLLYESQNKTLCEYYGSRITDRSLCYYGMEYTTDFDYICLKYFLSNSSVKWNHIHVSNKNSSRIYKLNSLLNNGDSGSACESLTIGFDDASLAYVFIENLSKPSSIFFHCKTINLEYFLFDTINLVLNTLDCVIENMLLVKNISICFCRTFRHSYEQIEQLQCYSSNGTLLQIAEKIKKSKTLETLQLKIDLDHYRNCHGILYHTSTSDDQSLEFIYSMLRIILTKGVSLSMSIKAINVCILGKPLSFEIPPCDFQEIIQSLTSNNNLKSIQLVLPFSCFLGPMRINRNNNLSALDIRNSGFLSYYPLIRVQTQQSNKKIVQEIANSCKHLEFIEIIYSVVTDHGNCYSLINNFLNLKVIDVKFIDATQDLNYILADFFSKMGNNQHCSIEALKVSVPGKQWKCNSICGEALQHLLQDNKTIQCLEICFAIPTNCLHYLRAGLQRNTVLKELTFTVFFSIAEELHVAEDIFFKTSSVTKLIIYMDPFKLYKALSNAWDSSRDNYFNVWTNVFTQYYLGIVPMILSLLHQNQQLESLMILYSHNAQEFHLHETISTQICEKVEETLQLFWNFVRHQSNLKYFELNDSSDLLIRSMKDILKETPENSEQEGVNSFPQIIIQNLTREPNHTHFDLSHAP